MRDILSDIEHWQSEGKSSALATVVQTWGSSPRKIGSTMALTLDGKIIGSVSGGCVENAVFEAGVEALETKRPRLLHFGVADETAWEVGLACGGSIDIFVNPLDSKFFQALSSMIKDETPITHITMIRSPDEMLGREMLISEKGVVIGSLGNEWHDAVLKIGREALLQGRARRAMLSESVEVFVDVILPPPTLVIVGGVHIAIALVSLAKLLGYQTILVDPRKAWGNVERFPHADQLIRAWPTEAFDQIKLTRSTAVAMLTHDPKLDDPALKIALSSPAFYVGALGSKSTHAKRIERLLNDGITEDQLSHLHAPIGLDIGAQSPEEIALAIMSEIVKAHRKQNQLSANREADVVSNL